MSGVIIDAETREPLVGVNVRIASTARGGATDAEGLFSLAVPAPGMVRLVVSSIGYETAVVETALAAGGSARIRIALAPAVVALGGAVVSARDPAEWRQALFHAQAVMLGGSPNGRASTLVNPEVLSLSFERDTLRATGEAPLVVRNARTGYNLTLYGFRLVAEHANWAWDATVTFEDRCPGGVCSEPVRQARRAACKGSPRHFLRALADDGLDGNGFQALLVGAPGQGRGAPRFIRQLLSLYEPRPPTARAVPRGWEVDIDRALEVTYHGEDDRRPGESGPQRSWITVDGGTLRFSADGTLAAPESVVLWGYWDWERIGDLVPLADCALRSAP